MWQLIIPIIWKAIRRFSSVILVGLVVILPYLWYKNYTKKQAISIQIKITESYNRGYKEGYSACIKERPTYGDVDTIIQNKEQKNLLNVGLFKLHLGAWWE